jgi:hypothetical protein
MIERYMQGELLPAEKLLFEARLVLNPEIRTEIHFQKRVYSLIKQYHRQKLKEELELMHQRIFKDPSKRGFRMKIYSLFKP